MNRFRKNRSYFFDDGQTAVEYLLLLSTVALVAFVGFQKLLPRVEGTSNRFFNKAAQSIMGKPADPFTPAPAAVPPPLFDLKLPPPPPPPEIEPPDATR